MSVHRYGKERDPKFVHVSAVFLDEEDLPLLVTAEAAIGADGEIILRGARALDLQAQEEDGDYDPVSRNYTTIRLAPLEKGRYRNNPYFKGLWDFGAHPDDPRKVVGSGSSAKLTETLVENNGDRMRRLIRERGQVDTRSWDERVRTLRERQGRKK